MRSATCHRDLDCEVLDEGSIVPWFIDDDREVDHVSHVMEKNGVFASAVRLPAVAEGEAHCSFHADGEPQRRAY
jgi:hypothetical protein